MQPYNKYHKIKWTHEASIAFEAIKHELNDCLTLFDENSPLYRLN